MEDVLASSKIKGLVTPLYDGQCISNLPATFAKLLGSDSKQAIASKEFFEFADEKTIENVVFVLLDGFGYRLIESARQRSRFPSYEKVMQGGISIPLTSVFPSTTSTATTTLHTGLTPQEHGVIGYTMYMRELGTIVEMLSFEPVFGRRNLFELGLDPGKFIGSKTMHEKFASEGIGSTLYINKYILGSGLSQITNRGAELVPTLTAPDMLTNLRKKLQSGSSRFHFCYHASPDTIAHARGPFSEEYSAEIESVFSSIKTELFEKLDRSIAKKTLLVISADHGLSHIDATGIIDISKHAALLDMLKVPPTGDSRCLIMHAKSEDYIERISSYFEQNFPGSFLMLESKAALKEGLFGRGEIRQEMKDRIGDLIMVPRGLRAIDNSILQPRKDHVPGRHGGLSENEMLVPLLANYVA